MHALIWLVYVQYCHFAYRSTQEFCFYCQWSMISEVVHCVLLNFMYGQATWYLYGLIFTLTSCVLFLTQANRIDRKYKAKQEKKERQAREQQLEERRLMEERKRRE